ncbi:MAG: type II secretion system F family protein [Solirubrobacteraceae bacterium]
MTRRDDSLAEVATVAQRLAVLLAAGVAPRSAWQHLGAGVPAVEADDIPGSLLNATRHLPPLDREAWRGLATAWIVATEAGAPLAPALRSYAVSLRSLAQAQRDAAVALAGPVATARLVMALPAVGLLFGLAMGFDTLGVLVGTPAGWACLALGATLVLLGARWNRRLVRSARPDAATPGLECELMAIAVSGGSAHPRAWASVEGALDRAGLAARRDRIDGVLELSRRAGVPAAELLRAEGEEARSEASATAQARAARLAVRLMLPLGLCVLPAFMVLGVLPLMIAVVTSTVRGF